MREATGVDCRLLGTLLKVNSVPHTAHCAHRTRLGCRKIVEVRPEGPTASKFA